MQTTEEERKICNNDVVMDLQQSNEVDTSIASDKANVSLG